MRLRVVSTIIGVMAGVASLVACFNFSSTARREILRTIRGLTPNLVFVRSTLSTGDSPPGSKPFSSDDARSIRTESPEITACTPVLQARRYFPEVKSSQKVLSLLGVWSEFPGVLGMTMEEGRFFSPFEEAERKRVCVVTRKTLDLLYPEGAPEDKTVRLFQAEFRIVGVVKEVEPCPFFRMDESIFVPYETLLSITNSPDEVRLIAMRLDERSEPGPAVARIESILMRNRQVPTFETWEQNAYIEKQKRVVSTIEWLLSSIAFLTLLTACIGCMNIMVVAVNERTREIGLRMAVGATPGSVLRMFLFEGLRIMAAGGVLGVVAGYYLTEQILMPLPRLITGYEGWTFTFTGEAVWKALAILGLCAFLSSLLPAWRAARLDPSRALRQE